MNSSKENYIPYKHVRLYLQNKYRENVSQNFRGTPHAVDEWMVELGFKNKNKFLRRLRQWLDRH